MQHVGSAQSAESVTTGKENRGLATKTGDLAMEEIALTSTSVTNAKTATQR